MGLSRNPCAQLWLRPVLFILFHCYFGICWVGLIIAGSSNRCCSNSRKPGRILPSLHFACDSHIFPAPFRPNWSSAVEKEPKPQDRFVTPVFEKFSCSLVAAFSLLFFALLESWLVCVVIFFLFDPFSSAQLFFVRPETVVRLRFSRISHPFTSYSHFPLIN